MTKNTECTAQKPLHVRCDDCDHVWVSCSLPMTVKDFVKQHSEIHCPSCASHEVYAAKKSAK